MVLFKWKRLAISCFGRKLVLGEPINKHSTRLLEVNIKGHHFKENQNNPLNSSLTMIFQSGHDFLPLVLEKQQGSVFISIGYLTQVKEKCRPTHQISKQRMLQPSNHSRHPLREALRELRMETKVLEPSAAPSSGCTLRGRRIGTHRRLEPESRDTHQRNDLCEPRLAHQPAHWKALNLQDW